MQWPDEILRDIAKRLDDSREIVRANIKRDLRKLEAAGLTTSLTAFGALTSSPRACGVA